MKLTRTLCWNVVVCGGDWRCGNAKWSVGCVTHRVFRYAACVAPPGAAVAAVHVIPAVARLKLVRLKLKLRIKLNSVGEASVTVTVGGVPPVRLNVRRRPSHSRLAPRLRTDEQQLRVCRVDLPQFLSKPLQTLCGWLMPS